jgi:integrase
MSRRTGQIIRRGDARFVVRIYLGSDANGKRRYHNHTVRGTKKDAQSWLTAALRRLDLGESLEMTTLSLNDYLDQWLVTAVTPKVRTHTLDDYTRTLARYVRPKLGKHKLTSITPMDLQALYGGMLADGLTARTVRLVHAVLSSAFKQGIRWQMLQQNPCANVELPKQQRKEMTALSPEQAARFLTAIQDNRYGILFSLMLATGIRPSEAYGLQWADLDWQRGLITIQRKLTRLRTGGWQFDEPKTVKSRRSIPLPASLLEALKTHRKAQLEERMRWGGEWQDNDLVFTSESGTPIHQRNLMRRYYKPALAKAGLPASLRLYDLRHTCATLLLADGENLKVVSERLGHSTITLTADVYAHVSESMQRQATDRMERLLYNGRN